jgi:ubiquinone/menaquinone biosynthesis C-methylase UbiE
MRNNLIYFAQKIYPLRKLVYYIGKWRSGRYLPRIEKYLKREDKILDVGSGLCNTVELLKNKGHKIVPLDIINLSFVNGIKPIIYDGGKMPFRNDEFDIALIVLVLHHTKNPEDILKEAKRVAKKIIIVEETYKNIFKKYITFIWDSVINLEFLGHPHNNKTDVEWKKLFQKLRLKLLFADYTIDLGFLEAATYFIEK